MARSLDRLFSKFVGESYDSRKVVIAVVSSLVFLLRIIFVRVVTLFDSRIVIDGYIETSLDFRFLFL